MKGKILFFILLFLIGCRKIDSEGYKTYTIKEGKHRSTYAYHTSIDTVFNWSIIFDSTAIYTTQDPANQYDINKLIGWSDCGENHMDYSIRFGWRWLNDNLEIQWFKHTNGSFDFAKICNVSLCEAHEYYLSLTGYKYKLCVDGNCVTIDRICPSDYKKYKLYPYFGGQETAPHDIKIKIKNT
jgi:hypothetical protein